MVTPDPDTHRLLAPEEDGDGDEGDDMASSVASIEQMPGAEHRDFIYIADDTILDSGHGVSNASLRDASLDESHDVQVGAEPVYELSGMHTNEQEQPPFNHVTTPEEAIAEEHDVETVPREKGAFSKLEKMFRSRGKNKPSRTSLDYERRVEGGQQGSVNRVEDGIGADQAGMNVLAYTIGFGTGRF